jgi:hypothetical protein
MVYVGPNSPGLIEMVAFTRRSAPMIEVIAPEAKPMAIQSTGMAVAAATK